MNSNLRSFETAQPQRLALSRLFPLALLPLAILAACSTTPATNARVEAARSSLRMTQTYPKTQGLACAAWTSWWLS